MRYCELRERARGTLTNFEWVKALFRSHRRPRIAIRWVKATLRPHRRLVVIVRRGKRPEPLGRVQCASQCIFVRASSPTKIWRDGANAIDAETLRLTRIDQSRSVRNTTYNILWFIKKWISLQKNTKNMFVHILLIFQIYSEQLFFEIKIIMEINVCVQLFNFTKEDIKIQSILVIEKNDKKI